MRTQRVVCAAAALWGLALLGILAYTPGLPGQPPKPSEDEVKAVYLFNFGKFVRWPTAASSTVSAGRSSATSFDICVVGRDPLADPLTRVTANEQLGGLPVKVRQVDSATLAKGCAIVYMGSGEAARMDLDLAALRGSEALTVSDLGNFLDRGGMMQFVIEGNRVRFAVNLDAVGRTDLQLSSELLKVAARVLGKPHQEVTP